MDYGLVEDEITEYLKGRLPDTSVIPLPEKESDFRYNSGNRIIVAFSGESAAAPQSTSQYSQHLTVTFALLVESRLLRGPNGLYALSEKVKQSMIGYKPSNCDAFYYMKQEFQDNEKDTFRHVLEFQTKTMRVQEYEEPNTPLLRSINYT